MTEKTLRAAKVLADLSGDDQSFDDIVSALCGRGPLLYHSGNQLAAMLVRHILQTNATGMSKTADSAPDSVRTVLRFLTKNAYWYGEDSGDYDMNNVHTEDWFLEAEQQLHKERK